MTDTNTEEHLKMALVPAANDIADEIAKKVSSGELSLQDALAQCDAEKTSEGADFQAGMKWDLVKVAIVKKATD